MWVQRGNEIGIIAEFFSFERGWSFFFWLRDGERKKKRRFMWPLYEGRLCQLACDCFRGESIALVVCIVASLSRFARDVSAE